MNANELANELEGYGVVYVKFEYRKQAATMLRQQQAEIEALKKSCLDEIFKRTYANQSAKVMEGYWQEAQAEIEALKLQLHTTLTNRDLRTYDGKTEMKNEPVAWAVWEGRPHDLFFTKEEADELCRLKGGDAKSIPLYTHPVKELTDEEIMVLYEEYIETQYASESNVLGFGRAILRKAIEK